MCISIIQLSLYSVNFILTYRTIAKISQIYCWIFIFGHVDCIDYRVINAWNRLPNSLQFKQFKFVGRLDVVTVSRIAVTQ